MSEKQDGPSSIPAAIYPSIVGCPKRPAISPRTRDSTSSSRSDSINVMGKVVLKNRLIRIVADAENQIQAAYMLASEARKHGDGCFHPRALLSISASFTRRGISRRRAPWDHKFTSPLYHPGPPGAGLRSTPDFVIFIQDTHSAAQCRSCCRLSKISDGCPL